MEMIEAVIILSVVGMIATFVLLLLFSSMH
jgi:hypothetical protein